jgi:hypothetical protein
MNGYDSAFAQATEERADIRLKIEQLLMRGEMLDKLLECLAPFVTSPKPVEESAPHSDYGADQGHAEEHHSHEEHAHHHHEG